MSVIKRMRNIFKANVNAALDSMEDPVKNLEVIAEDMRTEVATAKKKVAEAIAQEKLVYKELEEAQTALATWTKRAETALQSDREDLAREALKEKNKSRDKIPGLTSQWEYLKKENSRLKNELELMKERYEEVLSKKDELTAKAKVAKARSAAAFSPPPSVITEESHQAFSRAEDKIRKMEAQAEADREIAQSTSSSADKFAELERLEKNSAIDDELAQLKKNMKKD